MNSLFRFTHLIILTVFALSGTFLISGCGSYAEPAPDRTPSLFLDASFRYEVNGIPHAICVLPAGEYVPVAVDDQIIYYRLPKPLSINGRVDEVIYGIFLKPSDGKFKGWGVFLLSGPKFIKGTTYDFERPPFHTL